MLQLWCLQDPKYYTIGPVARTDTRIDACSVFRIDFRSSYIMNSTIAGIEVCVCVVKMFDLLMLRAEDSIKQSYSLHLRNRKHFPCFYRVIET